MLHNVIFMVRAGIARVSNHEDCYEVQSIPVVRDVASQLLTMKGMDSREWVSAADA